jgi:ATP-dependent helicase/nuclease subunit B
MGGTVPGSLRLLESPSAFHRIEGARAFIQSQPPDREILIVGASRGAADDLARLVAAARGAAFGLHRASLVELAARLALTHLARRGTVPATALGSEAVAARVAFQALQEGALHYYRPVVGFPGFPGALTRTLDEVRLARIAPEALEAVAEGDLSRLLRGFADQLDAGRLHDLAGLLQAAAEAARADPAPPLLTMPLVLLDVAVRSPAHQAFVGALVARAPCVLATLPEGDEATRRAFEALAPPAGAAAAPAPGPGSDELERLRAFLFSPQSPPGDARAGRVVLFSAPGEGRECVEIARLALEEARNGIAFDRMAVLLRTPQGYTPLLETALARAGIPAYFAQGTMRPDPAGRAFLAILDCAAERLSAKRFAEYLAFGQVPGGGTRGPRAAPHGGAASEAREWTAPQDEALGPAVNQPPAGDEAAAPIPVPPEAPGDDSPVLEGGLRAPWKWEALLVESAVIGGLDRWRRRLDGLGEEFRLRLQEVERESQAGQAQAVERHLRDLDHLRAFALPVIERLAALPSRGAWGDWIPALEALAPLVLRTPDRVLGVLADLRPLAPVGPVGLDEVREVLAPRLRTLERPAPPHRYGRLFVGSIEQGRGRAFDIVFVPGLAERVFPQKPREDPILLDAARRALAPALETQNDRSGYERFLLRLALGAARQRLYLSYPRVDVEAARSRVASFYALEVQRALTGTIPDPETLAREAEETGRSRLAWPAPVIPSAAIDDIEHDLATLHTLLIAEREMPEAAAGRARYLLDLNDWLARSLRSRWRRWAARWTPSDGLVRVTDDTREALEAARPTARAYSVGALEHFATCPYRFYLSAVYRLEPREEAVPLEHLDPRTRGALFHDVQAQAMRALAAAGQLPLTPARAAAARQVLDATLDRVAAGYRDRLAPAIPRVWETGIEGVRVDLRMWLERCIEAHATWEPVAFELAFGLGAARPAEVDPQSVAHEVVIDGGFRLRGIVDLVERRRGTADLRVTDHKTGSRRAPRGVVVGGGGTLQPVLYGLAAAQILGAPVVESRLFYCTRAGQFEERPVSLAGGEAAAKGRGVLQTIDRSVAAGFLPPAPLPRACRACDFRGVCGPDEERRLARKPPAPLHDLQTMRAWR